MESGRRKQSMMRLTIELVEQFIVLAFTELKLAALEIRRNIKSMEKGVVALMMGAVLLLFSGIGMLATAIAGLALILPVWLAALIVTVILVFFGAMLLFTGLSKLQHFTLVPSDTIQRVEEISKRLKKHTEHHAQSDHDREVDVTSRT
jgi:hypothetical protein